MKEATKKAKETEVTRSMKQSGKAELAKTAGKAKKAGTAKKAEVAKKGRFWQKPAVRALGLTLWVGLSFSFTSFVIGILMGVLVERGVMTLEWLQGPVGQAVMTAITYGICLLVVVFVPWLVRKMKTTRDEMGLRGLPTWKDIGLGIAGYGVSMVVTMAVILVLVLIFGNIPGFTDMLEQKQEVGFSNLVGAKEMAAAFVTLVVVAPFVEELIFRGWLYGKLRVRVSALLAIVLTSLLFGAVHLQLNVAIVVAIMSVANCLLRELTGTVWAGLLVHMLRNAVAFYGLFVLNLS